MKKILLRIGLVFLFLLAFPELSSSSPQTVQAASKKIWKNTLRKSNGKLYYYNSKGKKVRSCFQVINGKRYYFQSNAAAAVGFKTIHKKKYCFSSNGVMRTGWYKKGRNSYYFSPKTGVMYKGWKKIDRNTYYFNRNGILMKNTWIHGKYLNKNGICDFSKKPSMGRLKKKLIKEIRSYSGSWSVYIKNLDTNQTLTLNDQRIYSASLIKLFAMASVYDQIKQGRLKESSVKDDLHDMITISSNDSFNRLVRKIGKRKINHWCQKNGYLNTNQIHGLKPSNNLFELAEGYGQNYTSVRDCGKLLESIYHGTCINRSSSSKMLQLLKKQTRRSKIPAGIPSNVMIANKTGETDDVTHDVAIVYSRGATYILCIMARTPGNGWNSAKNITKLSRIVYRFFNIT